MWTREVWVVEVGRAVVVWVDRAGVLQIVVRVAVQIVRIAELVWIVVQTVWMGVNSGRMLKRVGVHSALMVVVMVSMGVIVATIVPRVMVQIVVPAIWMGRHSMRKALMMLPLMPFVLVVPSWSMVVMIRRWMGVESSSVIAVVRLFGLVALLLICVRVRLEELGHGDVIRFLLHELCD